MAQSDTTPRRGKRAKPKLGDALVVSYEWVELAEVTIAAVAYCECGHGPYTAVSSTIDGTVKIIRRKHVRHLATCEKQRELFALDEKV